MCGAKALSARGAKGWRQEPHVEAQAVDRQIEVEEKNRETGV